MGIDVLETSDLRQSARRRGKIITHAPTRFA